ncbi:MAG: molybdopterin-dependent oxidoreductase, partial [Deltaproteobacteria bacterium]|nr:molybdopterin-dependent oxidoreductase [Deltaproteobacteria bacterium]
NRREEFIATESRHPMTIDLKTGVTGDGVLVANEIRILADVGGYGTHYIGVIADCLSTGVGLYRIPNVDFQAAAVFTNTSLCGAFRGYGNPQMNFAQESQMDMIADNLGMDPVEFRRKNYRRLGEIDPIFNDEIRSNGLEECLDKGAKVFGWKDKRDSKAEKGSIRKGRGMAVLLHGTGAAKGLPDPASATVMINADGTVDLVTAAADDGQGNRTALAQIASEVLGIEMGKIGLSSTDTAVTPLDGGTHGSRQTYCGGLAVQKASEKARERILEYAAGELGAPRERLEIRSGVIYERENPDNRISVADLMRKTQITDMNLCEQIVETFSGVAPSMPGYYGANFAEVEVDTDTGQVRVTRLTGAFDVGRAINPDFVEGQITGGGVMGIGWALTEDLLIEKGEVLNGSFTDYRLLRSGDVPRMDSVIVESHEPTGPFGAKGIGEGSMVCVASAIANAVYDAVSVRIRDLPITPEKILRALER